ncbi:acyltransferase family protein [Nocardioides sp.]|uniref:acyltransferase family protein n=1 Tax=Nocardioides sp. TaxID=35761 RepID=UPI00286AA6C2|nr:acyltransferase family protein [Nocardioides sp.]
MSQATAEAVDAPKRTRLNYRPDIDGIRGAAAIGVMGYHANVPGFEGTFIGLDLFFVLSGFVIANLLLNEYDRSGTIKWGAFYARRARRLIPAKITMLLGVLILSYFLLTPVGAQQETARSVAAAAGFVSNIFFWQISGEVEYFAHQPGTGVLLHTWSLSVEEQFYLVLPILLILAVAISRLLRFDVRRILLVACLGLTAGSVYLAVAWAESSPEAAYYLPMSRAYEFLLGVALSLVVAKVSLPRWIREILGVVGLAIVVYAVIFPLSTVGYPNTTALVPCAAAIALVWAGCGSDTLATKVLKFPLFVGLGLVSYGWYLWHWPLLVIGESVNLAPPPLAIRIGLVLLALGIALLSYRYIEGVFYARGGGAAPSISFKPRNAILVGVTAMATVAALGGGALAVARDQATSDKWTQVQAQLDDYPLMPPVCVKREDLIPQRPGACNLTAFDADRPTIVLWGDSHAWMMIPAARAAIANRDVNLVAFVMGSCPPMDPDRSATARKRPLDCVVNNELALDYVRDLVDRGRTVRVVLGASWEIYRGVESGSLMTRRATELGQPRYLDTIQPYFEKGTPRVFQTLGRLGVPVDVIAPTAELPRSAPLCLSGPRPYSCDSVAAEISRSEASTRIWLAGQMGRLAGRPRLIDVNKTICDDVYCRAEIDDTIAYFDDDHLSATMARSLKNYFKPTVDSLL